MDLTGAATLALVAVTLWLVWETRISSKRQIGVQTWLTLLQRFDSNEMKQARKRLVPQLNAYDRTKLSASTAKRATHSIRTDMYVSIL